MKKMIHTLIIAATLLLFPFHITATAENGAQWIDSGSRRWYRHADGSYTTNNWEQIDDNWYYFDGAGWMVANQWVGNYYLTSSGAMATDTWIGIYHVNKDGLWDQTKYPQEWIRSGNRWWYRHEDGGYTKNGWEEIDGKWYYFDGSGWMVANQWVGNYYLTSSGAMATDTWIGEYYVDQNGLWDSTRVKPRWIQSGNRWWYRHSDGGYTTNGWEEINGEWYYFDGAGWMASSQWIGNYFVNASGAMARNMWVGRYHVNENGLWDNTRSTESIGIMIVNKKHGLSADYAPGENATAGNQIRTLIRDMRNAGYAVSTNYSGYRSYSYQASLYQNYVNRDGRSRADRYSARPGYSEHQTGLAFDLMSPNGALLQTKREVNWVAERAHEYGFIVRYQEGTEHITGYMAEPWHLRYVGSEASQIYQTGLTLEEYLGVEGGDYN